MVISLEEFSHEFFQEVLSEADAEGRFAEDVFFGKYCEHLTDAGELETADRADYRGRSGSGVRVDGYGGDPLETENTLSLMILDFQQSTEVGRLTATDMNAAFQRLTKFVKRSLDPSWRSALEETTPAFGLADLIASRWDQILKIRLLLLSNRQLSDRVDGREAEELEGRPVTYNVWDINRLYRFATSGHAREEIEIDLEEDFGTTLPLLRAHLQADDYESYLAVLPGHMLARIYDRWGARLLEQNVRVFLQARGNVNKGIRGTLERDPEMFFAYNNGITATAERVETEVSGGQMWLKRLHNLQIVNGGQTTASIHAGLMNNVDLGKVFVQMKLSVVSAGRIDEVVPRISEYANSQNKVNAADFFANHPFHVRLEEFSRRLYAPSSDGTFRETKWFYERARGQYESARSYLSAAQRKKFELEHPRAQRFSKTDLAKFLNVWNQRPEKVSMGAQKNFADFAKVVDKAWEANANDFNESFYREAVAKAIIFRSTERIVSNQPWYEGGYRANIVAYAIARLACEIDFSGKVVDFQLIWRGQTITSDMEAVLAQFAKAVCGVLVEPPTGIRNVTEWAKKQACWERTKALSVDLPRAFMNELINKDENRLEKREARKDQKVLNGIEAQTMVVTAGGHFWSGVRAWGTEQSLLTDIDDGVLKVAGLIPTKLPTEKQCLKIVEIYRRLRASGLESELPVAGR